MGSVLQFASGFFPTRPRRAEQLLLAYSCLHQALQGTRTPNPSFISNTLSWPTGRYGGRERQDIDHSYSKRSLWVRAGGRAEGREDDRPKPGEKSDLLVLARKLGKASGAKGEMD